MTWWLIGASSAALACFFVGVTRPLLARLKLIDIPNHRSSHEAATIRGGGLGVLLGLTTASLAALAGIGEVDIVITSVLASVIGLGTLGFLEDVGGLSVPARLAGQFTVGTVVAVATLSVLDAPLWWGVGLSPAALFMVNGANFMDGINGISALHGVIAGATALAVGLATDSRGLWMMGAMVAGAFAGFLPWNFPRARLFLGDVGSYVLGATQWALAFHIWLTTSSLLIAVGAVSIYATDVVTTLITRTIRGDRLTSAHKDHTYQRVREATGSHAVSSLYTATGSVAASAAALAVWATGAPTALGWASILVISLTYKAVGFGLTRKHTR